MSGDSGQEKLDVHYFSLKLRWLFTHVTNHTPAEMARTLAQLANTAFSYIAAEESFRLTDNVARLHIMQQYCHGCGTHNKYGEKPCQCENET